MGKIMGRSIGKQNLDSVSDKILDLINNAKEPLETKEIEAAVSSKIKTESVTRTKIFYRLNILRGEGKVKGKFTGPGKGVWIWWSFNAFKND